MHRSLPLLLALALVTVALAGCIGSEDGTDPSAPSPDDPTHETAFVPEPPAEDLMDMLPVMHPDHQNPESHAQAVGLTLVGHDSLADITPETKQGGWTEIDIHGTLAAVATYRGDSGVVLVDIADPAAPEPLSFIPSAGADYDARISQDGRTLFFGCQPGDTAPAEGRLGDCLAGFPEGVSPEASEQTSGLVAYDITDPRQPALAGFLGGVATHNLFTTEINGTDHIFTNGVEIVAFDPSQGVEESLSIVAEVPGGHDAYVHEHPVTGDRLLYTTAGGTFAIFEINDPTNPSVLVEQGPEVAGWHQQRAADQLLDGRAILVVGDEIFQDQGGTLDGSPPPVFTILDITDPAQPEVLSEWTLPVSDLPPWTNYRFSPHNIDITPYGQVSVAWNHAGTWVFDISTQERQEDPVTLGFYQPHETPPALAPTINPTGDMAIPRVWGGAFDDRGYLVVPDMFTGLYVLEPAWGLLPG